MSSNFTKSGTIDFSRDPSYNYNYQIIMLIIKMHDAKLNEEWAKYWLAFDTIFKNIYLHLSETKKNELQNEYNKLYHAEKEIEKKEINEIAKKNLIIELRKNFALTYEREIAPGLAGLDIIKVDNQGEINFGGKDIEEISRIVRRSNLRDAPEPEDNIEVDSENE